MKKEWSGERLETFINNRIAVEHLHRYAFVNEYINDTIILDIACGEGYGANLMSKNSKFVYAVDIDQECIEKARLKYQSNNIEFLVGSTSKIPLNDNSVDVVISFETIEHHDEHDIMLTEIKRVLKKEGILILSTPDKLYYSEMRNLINEFHVKELYKNEFEELISKYFRNIQLFSQYYNNANSLLLKNSSNEINAFNGNFLNINQKTVNPLFHIIIASDFEFNICKNSIFDGSQLVNSNTADMIKKSYKYRLGSSILFPFSVSKKIFKKIFFQFI